MRTITIGTVDNTKTYRLTLIPSSGAREVFASAADTADDVAAALAAQINAGSTYVQNYLNHAGPVVWLALLGRVVYGDPVAGGDLEVVVGNTYPLSEAARAHEDMQERRTSGKLLLDPSS